MFSRKHCLLFGCCDGSNPGINRVQIVMVDPLQETTHPDRTGTKSYSSVPVNKNLFHFFTKLIHQFIKNKKPTIPRPVSPLAPQRIPQSCKIDCVKDSGASDQYISLDRCLQLVLISYRKLGPIASFSCEILCKISRIEDGVAQTASSGKDWVYIEGSKWVLPRMRANGYGVIVNHASDWGVAAAEEIARAVLFLASEDAPDVTGTCLLVDSGNTAR